MNALMKVSFVPEAGNLLKHHPSDSTESYDFFSVIVPSLYKDSVEPVNLFQPSVHMLSVTWRWDDTPLQLMVGSEPLTLAASQTSCELKGEEGPALRGADGDGGSLGPRKDRLAILPHSRA